MRLHVYKWTCWWLVTFSCQQEVLCDLQNHWSNLGLNLFWCQNQLNCSSLCFLNPLWMPWRAVFHYEYFCLGRCDSLPVLASWQVGQGCATALALLFDKDQSVKFILDRDLVEGGHERIYFHPMTNSATMGLRPDDLLRFLKETGHEPILESFD